MVRLPPGVFVHVDAPEVVADGEEEGEVVAGNHQHRQDVQECPHPLVDWKLQKQSKALCCNTFHCHN